MSIEQFSSNLSALEIRSVFFGQILRIFVLEKYLLNNIHEKSYVYVQQPEVGIWDSNPNDPDQIPIPIPIWDLELGFGIDFEKFGIWDWDWD